MNYKLKIQNLKCEGCANTIVSHLSKIDGVSDVIVDNNTDEVSFTTTSERITELVKTKLSRLGYPVVGADNSLPKKAKSFVSCVVGRMSKK